MAVAFDTKGSMGGLQFSSVTTLTTPAFTIGSGSNRIAIAFLVLTLNTPSAISISVGGVAGSLISGTDSGTTASHRSLAFVILNPPSGSKTATASWTTASDGNLMILTFTGADQTTGANGGTFKASNSWGTASVSMSITSNNGDMTCSGAFDFTNQFAASPTNQTLETNDDTRVECTDHGPGTGTTTHTWSDSIAGQGITMSGVNVIQASSGPTSGVPFMRNPGGGFGGGFHAKYEYNRGRKLWLPNA